ncbi:hypothetical protein UFOVP500_17 [uncultured Caudovirales phage]|jgi:hypothetical protein|uniref:Uncharacterized protein n=1 Tax=uncultured Caudovirales phage TaxID=2100421 RepID=A0A6J5MSC2_9CAUD|nr:hypothetical protein UFOVP500_17 [uncultured Caudovirales phage]
MAGLTNFGEDLVLDFLFTTTTATRPTAWYVSLYTVAPGEGTAGTEVSGGSYARTSATFTVSGTAPTQAANNAAVEFPTASASWGTVVAAGIMDASTGGNLIAFADLTTSKAIASGDILRFSTNTLIITLD